MKRYIIKGLEEYLNTSHHPWHMPGHKRRGICGSDDVERIGIGELLDGIYGMDVTEVPGTDDLHHPEGIIKQSQNELARVYETFASYYLVNGSTCGILTAIAACFDEENSCGKRSIIVADNCHKSVYNAVSIFGLNPIYIKPVEMAGPRVGGFISVDDVRDICENSRDIGAMVLTSPNYEGIISDIGAISGVLKEYGIKLIVDEAHGAHLPFTGNAVSSIRLGADIVVQSLHKTLPALTQTAVMHVMNEALDKAVRRYKAVFMSSSPSYVLLASMENAVAWACEQDFTDYLRTLDNFRNKATGLKRIHILDGRDIIRQGAFDYDETRIVLWSESVSGTRLEELLSREGNIVCEMSGLDYVVLISTAMDSDKDFDRLYEVICRVDEILSNGKSNINYDKNYDKKSENKQDYNGSIDYYEKNHNDNAKGQEIIDKINSLIGTCAKENIYVYPPGSYICTRGETITKEKAQILISYTRSGKKIRGIE